MFYNKAIEKKKDEAMNAFGTFYHFGIYFEKNLEKAVEFYEKAIEKENSKAMNNLAILNEETGNYQKSLELYERAIMLDNSDAFYNLGLLYFGTKTGTGIPKPNISKSLEYFNQSAKLKNLRAIKKIADFGN